MRAETPIKEELIVEAALRRFTHFGFHKTTFSEIAKDLGVSQQSLYYYFPDKKSLIVKVAINIMTNLMVAIKETLASKETLEEKLISMVEVKQDFFEKYFMLATERPVADKMQDPNEFKSFVKEMEDEQMKIMVSEFTNAVERREIRNVDVRKKALLLQKATTAMQDNYRICHIIPDHDSIRELFEEQKDLIRIYVSGLKQSICNN